MKPLEVFLQNRRQNLLRIFIIFCIVFTFSAGYVFAQGNGRTYTGCLDRNGRLYDIALGLEPLKPCKLGDQQINLGNGDILGVIAGPGLQDGGQEGDVSLSADTQYLQRRVTQSCLVGESIRAINPDGTVVCEPNGSTSGYTIARTTTNLDCIAQLEWWNTSECGIRDNFPVGAGPVALAFDGEHIWVANSLDNTVTALNMIDGSRAFPDISVGTKPVSLAVDQRQHRIWVVNNSRVVSLDGVFCDMIGANIIRGREHGETCANQRFLSKRSLSRLWEVAERSAETEP